MSRRGATRKRLASVERSNEELARAAQHNADIAMGLSMTAQALVYQRFWGEVEKAAILQFMLECSVNRPHVAVHEVLDAIEASVWCWPTANILAGISVETALEPPPLVVCR